MGLLGKFKRDEPKEPSPEMRITDTPLRRLAQSYLTTAQTSNLEADSKRVLGGSILGGLNPLPILKKLAGNLPDVALEAIADSVVQMADEIRAIRAAEARELNGPGESIQDYTVAQGG